MAKAAHRSPRDKGRLILKPRGPVEVSQGEGLGALLTLEEGRRRAHEYATPMALEDLAGVTAGPVQVALKLGTSHSTLQAWRTKRLAIGLLNGARKTVFSLEQFVDGKPVAGIAAAGAICLTVF